MPDKFLLIGVGGSGGKTLRYLWRELTMRLAETPWQGGIPDAWRFIHIDLPHEPDVIEGDVPASMENAQASYIGLGRPGRKYRDYDRDLVAAGDLTPLAGWRPDPDAQIPPPALGAGQRRSVGRIVTLSQLRRVGDDLQRALFQLGTADVMSQLQALAGELGQDPPKEDSALRTIVISSLGGGSGSGAFLDIVELLKTLPASPQQGVADGLMTVLYAPDVFGELDRMARLGIEPNTLAALSELLSGAEHEGELLEVDEQLLSRGGGTNQFSGQRTARHNFFIGARNNAVAFTTSHQVYQAVAKALAAFIAHDDMREKFDKYGLNVRPTTVTPEFAISDPNANDRAGRSFGYASVTLGNTLFAKYATERLAKAAVERLLRGHREGIDETTPRRDDDLVADRVKRELDSFLNSSGLREYSAEHNQVLDALRDADLKIKRARALAQKVKTDIQSKSDKKSPGEWLASFSSTFKTRERDFVTEERAERLKKAAEWSQSVQDQLLDTVAASIGANGLPATAGLLERLQHDVLNAADELDRSSTMLREESDALLNKATGRIGSLRDRVITSAHGSFGDAAKDRAMGVLKYTEADLHSFTAGVLREVHNEFLPPLRRAVAQAENRLRTLVEDNKEVLQWSLRAVPPHLLPAPNDILLEDHERFPSRLDELLSVQFDAGSEQSQSDALRELISGAWPRTAEDAVDAGHQRLIEGSGSWSPSVAGEGLKPGAFTIPLDPAGILREAGNWVRNRKEGEVTRSVRGSLADWLDAKKPDAPARAQRFADAIDLALAASAPLVSVNPATYSVVHGEEMPRGKPAVGPIPIGPDHDAHGRISEALKSRGLSDGEVRDILRPGGRPVSAVEISSFVGSAVHPVVFSSLVDPIQADWRSRKGPQDRAQFWQFARARPLEAFVPLSGWRLRALVRGWLTANLLGQVPRLERPWSSGEPLGVWTPRGRQRFSRHLLGGDVRQHGLVLPALVESMPLALLELAAGDGEVVAAYLRLLELGQPGGDESKAYPEANPELEAWIQSAALREPDPGFEPAPEPNPALAGARHADHSARGAAILNAIVRYRSDYEERRALRVTAETSLTVGRGWEIRDAAIDAASQLAAVVEELSRKEPAQDSWG